MTQRQASNWKGIVLAGGSGTRLHPITLVVSKQTMPIYDKPMIYYPISTLMLGGIRDILIISTPQDVGKFEKLLGDGSRLGVNFSYAEQAEPRGIAEAFLIGADFIGNFSVSLILGDNFFYGSMDFLRKALTQTEGATVFGYPVNNPEQYGVVEFDGSGKVISIEEKPRKPKSKYAVAGLYCYDNRVIQMARTLKPSARNELEITDINKLYLQQNDLRVAIMGRGIAWLDTGSPQNLLDASNFVAGIEKRQGFKIGCLEEVAYRMGYINAGDLSKLAAEFSNEYGMYLDVIANEDKTSNVN